MQRPGWIMLLGLGMLVAVVAWRSMLVLRGRAAPRSIVQDIHPGFLLFVVGTMLDDPWMTVCIVAGLALEGWRWWRKKDPALRD